MTWFDNWVFTMKEDKVTSVIALNSIIILLGVVLLTQFYGFLFSQTDWLKYLSYLEQFIPTHSFRYAFIDFLKYTSPFSYILFTAGILVSALACITLYARFYTGLVVALAFFIVWILNWNVPGVWPYQYLFPACFALLAGLGSRRLSQGFQALFSQLGFSFLKQVIVIGLTAFFLHYVTSIAFNQIVFEHKVGFYSGLTFFIVSIAINCLLKQNLEKDEQNVVNRYLDFMVLAIGSMLVMQVYANHFSGLFELKDYKESLLYYGNRSNAQWLHGFLLFSANHSQLILPFYVLFEITLSISLSLLLFRAPVLLLTGVLLGILAFAELGVSSTWPPNPNYLTWQWELLLGTLVAFILGIEKTWQLMNHFSIKYMVLGDPICKNALSLFKIVLIALLSGFGLYFICIFTQVFGASYRSTALFAGISFALLIFILLITDQIRHHDK